MGKRIQQALKKVLEYDCSVGVATNKARRGDKRDKREEAR